MPKEMLAAGSVVFIQPTDVRHGGSITQWWQYVPGANWRQPTGPGSSITGKDNHPVVHIAYEDALAYARRRGRSLPTELPTEAQWEYAARGGRDGENDWSGAIDAKGKPVANTWQGLFPVLNTNKDGYVGAAPVGCFKPNGYGLYDMIGNVWEWTSDWYRPGHPREPAENPTGPDVSTMRAISSGRAPAARVRPQCRPPRLSDCADSAQVVLPTNARVRQCPA